MPSECLCFLVLLFVVLDFNSVHLTPCCSLGLKLPVVMRVDSSVQEEFKNSDIVLTRTIILITTATIVATAFTP